MSRHEGYEQRLAEFARRRGVAVPTPPGAPAVETEQARRFREEQHNWARRTGHIPVGGVREAGTCFLGIHRGSDVQGRIDAHAELLAQDPFVRDLRQLTADVADLQAAVDASAARQRQSAGRMDTAVEGYEQRLRRLASERGFTVPELPGDRAREALADNGIGRVQEAFVATVGLQPGFMPATGTKVFADREDRADTGRRGHRSIKDWCGVIKEVLADGRALLSIHRNDLDVLKDPESRELLRLAPSRGGQYADLVPKD